ncbi:hypothetical protein CDL15_Pgr010508 [Punica granatum]|uniref:Uncharacterized protein n=1 Tax=Punica granatum TaxID=22663 RepID=A0A218XXI2_PUNGR|nr:hypothetical protein CDL15_Pgr010508 [Punica granatum]
MRKTSTSRWDWGSGLVGGACSNETRHAMQLPLQMGGGTGEGKREQGLRRARPSVAELIIAYVGEKKKSMALGNHLTWSYMKAKRK